LAAVRSTPRPARSRTCSTSATAAETMRCSSIRGPASRRRTTTTATVMMTTTATVTTITTTATAMTVTTATIMDMTAVTITDRSVMKHSRTVWLFAAGFGLADTAFAAERQGSAGENPHPIHLICSPVAATEWPYDADFRQRSLYFLRLPIEMHVSWNRQPVGLCFFPYRHGRTWKICVAKRPCGNCYPLRFEARKQPVNSGAACGAEVEVDISATVSFAPVESCRTGYHHFVALPIATDGDDRAGATLTFLAATGCNQFWFSSCLHI
jgi:hypothetical protein